MVTMCREDLCVRVPEEKARAIRDAVRERCRYLGLGPEDVTRCINSAIACAKNGNSAALAIDNGNALADRIANPKGVRGKKSGAPLPGAA